MSDGGSAGEVYIGALPTVSARVEEQPELQRILGWADELRRLQIWTNADKPEEAAQARSYGAQGIGLCRTEHMFREGERLEIVRDAILVAFQATRAKERRAAGGELDGERIELSGWPGMVGHNWGAEHAERWVGLPGAGFAEAPRAWLAGATGRWRRLAGLEVDAHGTAHLRAAGQDTASDELPDPSFRDPEDRRRFLDRVAVHHGAVSVLPSVERGPRALSNRRATHRRAICIISGLMSRPIQVSTLPGHDFGLPPTLEGLAELAYNWWWSWTPRAGALFGRIDSPSWRRHRNPIPVLLGTDAARWAELDDTRSVPVEVSLTLLEALHVRWVAVWRAMRPAAWARGARHPAPRTRPGTAPSWGRSPACPPPR